MNAYNRVFWQDHVVDEEGKVIQQGTNLSEGNFNRSEVGVYDAYMAIMLLNMYARNNAEYLEELDCEEKTVVLTNSEKFPFNSTHNTPVTVAITTRKTANYTVEFEVVEEVGGIAGDLKVTNKLYNGFKLEFDGNATQITVKCKIRGGIKY